MATSGFGGRGYLMMGVLALAAVWGVVNTSLAASVAGPVHMVAANLRLFIGFGIIAMLAYWVLDEADENDDVSDALEKTSDRAADASGGFINVTRVFLAGLATIIATSGDALIDMITMAPTIAGQVGIGLLGAGAGAGMLSVRMFAIIAVAVIVFSAILKERAES
ncbi:hypothetical protein [Halosimplex amylolyticum]|uniref:hypothetical protein n=1 Tax=Halosimplex amylolyticum TaxID=3396616 RepID=UPI003F56660C